MALDPEAKYKKKYFELQKNYTCFKGAFPSGKTLKPISNNFSCSR